MKQVLLYLALSILLAVLHVTLIRTNAPENLANTLSEIRSWVVPGANPTHSRFLLESDYWPNINQRRLSTTSRSAIYKDRDPSRVVRSFEGTPSFTEESQMHRSRYVRVQRRFPLLQYTNSPIPRRNAYYYRGNRKLSRHHLHFRVGRIRKNNDRRELSQRPHTIAKLTEMMIEKMLKKLKAHNSSYSKRIQHIADPSKH